MTSTAACRLGPARPHSPAISETRPSLYLCDTEHTAEDEFDVFARLEDEERRCLLEAGAVRELRAGQAIFRQADLHQDIHVILSGIVRVYCAGPSGREITLAYWWPGNFVGGPELFGDSPHMWSGSAARPARVLTLRVRDLRRLPNDIPLRHQPGRRPRLQGKVLLGSGAHAGDALRGRATGAAPADHDGSPSDGHPQWPARWTSLDTRRAGKDGRCDAPMGLNDPGALLRRGPYRGPRAPDRRPRRSPPARTRALTPPTR